MNQKVLVEVEVADTAVAIIAVDTDEATGVAVDMNAEEVVTVEMVITTDTRWCRLVR